MRRILLFLAFLLCSAFRTQAQTQIGGGGGGISSNSAIPGAPGVTAVPVTLGLMAEYRILSTETPSGLLDYSGNSRNATGTIGTSPTIISSTGGIQCNANGAVVLPTALNGARDVFIYYGLQTNFGGTYPAWQAFIIGGGAPANSAGMAVSNFPITAAGKPADRNVGVLEPVAGGGVTNYILQGGNGNNLVEWDLDTVDHTFLNGVEVAYDPGIGVPTASNGINTSAFQICGGAAGSGLGTQTYLQGQIYYVALYNRVLNPAERASVSNYIISAMAARNVPVNPTITSISGNTVLFQGDSQTAGLGVNTSYPAVVALNNIATTNVPNAALSQSGTVQEFATAGPSLTQAYFQPNAQLNLVHYWIGTNDMCGGATAAATMGFLQKAVHDIRSYGGNVIVSTMISRGGGCDTGKNTFNALLRANWRQIGAAALNDIAADPNLGADGASAVTTFFQGDGIHPNQNGVYNNVTPIVQRGINRFFGNTDFSTATVYASAAAAAVATTAGSQSSNTMTFTFAATPANCLVGNTITIAGTTPAGYSNPLGWTILTRSATQVTAWNNTTGLGAITVQGTGVCPQQQDADQYSIVNFGAGNYTLESCMGYTGQNIYIRNINAGATTLAPFNTETITGAGATPTTLAANTTAILQSQLVSSAAGGCNWVRLQ